MCLLCFSHIYFSSSSPQFNYLSLRIRIYKVMSSLAFGACRQRQIRHETTTYPSGLYKKKKKGKIQLHATWSVVSVQRPLYQGL